VKKKTTPRPTVNLEQLARRQGVKPIRSAADLYRHSVRDDEDLDRWLEEWHRLRGHKRSRRSKSL